LALSCDMLVDPALPSDAVRFTPPPVYARWWAITEACSGITRSLDAIQFYRVPNASTIPDATYGEVAAYWSQAGNRIVLAQFYEAEGRVVRHEMLHALLRGGGHPPAYFQGRCAGVVDCSEIGCQDAGKPPEIASAGAPALPVEALDVAVDVAPNPVSRSSNDGMITLVVRVTNPTRSAVWVPLETTPDVRGSWRHWYGFRFAHAGEPVPITDLAHSDSAGMITTDSARVPFAAGQTRQWVIDMPAALYRAGDYTAVGIFNTRQVWIPLKIVQ
ncbi:MAG TPA: hypothetical protein VJ865_05730, partial [Gemmatimonadaceae bacterium]|nr:hypothetical protein [Gemmatimonadaceae bacterium]